VTRTFDHEDALPRVPLPTVGASCDRLLEWAAPLLTADELAQTEKAVTRFREDPGTHRLHAALTEYAARPGVHSWLDDFWRTRYLGRRDRIALNANFFFLFQSDGRPQVERAAALTAAAVAYQRRIAAQEVPPEELRGRPLSMVQLRYLFSACRIPGAEIDSSRTAFPATARHVVVFHHGAVFALDVVSPDGTPHTEAELAGALRAVLAASPRRGDAVGQPHHEGPRRVGREPRRAALARPGQRRGLRDDRDGAVLRRARGRRARRRAGGVRPPAARRPGQPLVRQVAHPGRPR
jgi:carnitine O-acetyltransferase